MLIAIIAIIGGLIAAASLIVSKLPSAKGLIDKLIPIQGFIGVVLLIWGIFGIFGVISGLSWLADFPIRWALDLLITLCELVVGFILAYALLSQYLLSKNEAAKAKGEALRVKLTAYQTIAGIVLICLGVLYIFF